MDQKALTVIKITFLEDQLKNTVVQLTDHELLLEVKKLELSELSPLSMNPAAYQQSEERIKADIKAQENGIKILNRNIKIISNMLDKLKSEVK